MAEAPNLSISHEQLVLHFARLEGRLSTIDMPFVEDRLGNLERVAVTLDRAVDGLLARVEAFRVLAGALEASVRSLERERRVTSDLTARISSLELVSRQETQGALERQQDALENMNRRLERLEAFAFPESP